MYKSRSCSDDVFSLDVFSFWAVVPIVFIFTLFGPNDPILTNIFEMAWNHQLDAILISVLFHRSRQIS